MRIRLHKHFIVSQYFPAHRPLTRLLHVESHGQKIVCIGRNYADHISETDSARPKKPFFFLKPASSILYPDTGPVIRPRGVDLNHEVELAFSMGRRLRNLKQDDESGAMAAISHYHVCIDMTARNIQNEAKDKGLPWDIAKGFDTFLPISNAMRKESILDPYNVELFLKVNGEIRQQDSTRLMLFDITRILSDISHVMTLEQGDIVLTGTPKGVGAVKAGDVMIAGVRVGGKEVENGSINVAVEDSQSEYEFKET